VQRIELWMSLFAGASGGLLGVMWRGLVSEPWLARATGTRTEAQTSAQMVLAAGARTAAGAVLGALYWAGWGLIALVTAPWYGVGLAFGVLCWAGVALPALGTLRETGTVATTALRIHAVEWLATCIGIGLACAWVWQRPP
jgi:hypothetical protein